jgi:hypothetical protein
MFALTLDVFMYMQGEVCEDLTLQLASQLSRAFNSQLSSILLVDT